MSGGIDDLVIHVLHFQSARMVHDAHPDDIAARRAYILASEMLEKEIMTYAARWYE